MSRNVMWKNDLFSLALLLVAPLCLATVGCTVQDIPAQPTFEADILPITVSRCVRCHGGGGTLNADPDHTGIDPGSAPFNGYFDRLQDECPDASVPDGGYPAPCKYGLLHYAMPPATLLRQYIDCASADTCMPPPPSPTLTSRQLEIFDRWLAETPPM